MVLLATRMVVLDCGVSNRVFHDFSGFLFTADDHELLSLGPNFAITPQPDSEFSFLGESYAEYDRKVHLAWYMRDRLPDDVPAKFRIPS